MNKHSRSSVSSICYSLNSTGIASQKGRDQIVISRTKIADPSKFLIIYTQTAIPRKLVVVASMLPASPIEFPLPLSMPYDLTG